MVSDTGDSWDSGLAVSYECVGVTHARVRACVRAGVCHRRAAPAPSLSYRDSYNRFTVSFNLTP